MDSKSTLTVIRLIERLATTPFQSLAVSKALRANQKDRISDGLHSGKSYGEAVGGLSFLGKSSTPAYLKSIQNDLGRQVEICNEVLDQHFGMGEPIYPGYFSRVALLLRKAKSMDLERDFIQAYAMHSYDAPTATDKKMSARADKLDVAPTNPPKFPKAGSAV